jgi:glycolate oxidase FAD binding subunit
MDVSAVVDILGADGVLAAEAAAAHGVSGVVPAVVAVPGDREQAGALIRRAREEGWALVPYGGGTQVDFGFPPARLDVAVSTARLDRVVDYQPDDMTLTVEPGVTLHRVGEILAPRGQFLPLNPPRPEKATVGGMMAAASSGPWRAGYGTPRDWIIGCRVVGADAQEVRGGGQVVKNVAGYDLPKLYTGSFGTLGLITEVTFKVLPQPPAVAVCRVSIPRAEQLEALVGRVLSSDLQPCALDAQYAEGRWAVTVELRHFPEALAWQTSHLGTIAVNLGLEATILADAEASAAMTELRDRPTALPFLARIGTLSSRIGETASALVRLCERRGIAPLVFAHAATGQAFFQADVADTELASEIRAIAREAGASCAFPSLPAGLAGAIDPWGEPGPELALMRGIKDKLDPTRIFSPGRFVGRL